MRISARTEYAVLALMKLAQHVDLHPMRAKDIAESADIPKAFLDQLLLDLRRAGLIRSIRGPGGGSPWLTTLKTYCYMTSYWRSIALLFVLHVGSRQRMAHPVRFQLIAL